MKTNPTLERIKDAIIDLLDKEGLCLSVNGCFIPMPLGRDIADSLNRLFYVKGWTPSQAHALEYLLKPIIKQAKKVGVDEAQAFHDANVNGRRRDPSMPVRTRPAQS